MHLFWELGYQVISKLFVTGFFVLLTYLTDAVLIVSVVESAEIR